jgi:hypothetical protein
MKELMHTRPSYLVRESASTVPSRQDYHQLRIDSAEERRPIFPMLPAVLFDDSHREGCERILRHRTAGEIRVVRLHNWDIERDDDR